MFQLFADKTRLTVLERETLTSGSVNAAAVRFTFSPEWEGLVKTAVFQAGEVSRIVSLEEDGLCRIPREVLEAPEVFLRAGVLGVRGEDVVLPTVWASLGFVREGTAETVRPAPPPSLPLWLRYLAGKGDRLAYTAAGELGLYAGETLLCTVPLREGDHRLLANRDQPEQHPVEAVSGLDEISNLEVLNLWNGG